MHLEKEKTKAVLVSVTYCCVVKYPKTSTVTLPKGQGYGEA